MSSFILPFLVAFVAWATIYFTIKEVVDWFIQRKDRKLKNSVERYRRGRR